MKIIEKAWYLFLIVIYSFAYFTYAVASGVWGWIKEIFSKKKKMNTQEISINEIRQRLYKHLVGPKFPSEKAVELYCFINKKWGYIKYDENGHNPMAVIQDRHDS